MAALEQLGLASYLPSELLVKTHETLNATVAFMPEMVQEPWQSASSDAQCEIVAIFLISISVLLAVALASSFLGGASGGSRG